MFREVNRQLKGASQGRAELCGWHVGVEHDAFVDAMQRQCLAHPAKVRKGLLGASAVDWSRAE